MNEEPSLPVPSFVVPEKLVFEIAVGLEEPEKIAARYAFMGAKWEQLKEWKPFKDAVDTQIAELQRSGYTPRLKARLMFDELSAHFFVLLMSDQSTIPQKLEGLKLFAKIGDLEPKESTAIQAGTGWSLTINIPAMTPKAVEKVVVEEEPEKKFSLPMYFDAEPVEVISITPYEGQDEEAPQPDRVLSLGPPSAVSPS